MGIAEVSRMVLALAVTLGVIGLAAVLARRFMPGALLRFKAPADRRMAVVESLILDPSRRLVLVRCDQQEKLLLLGEGRLLASGLAQAPMEPAEPGEAAA